MLCNTCCFFPEWCRENLFVALLFDALSSCTVYGRDVSLQPIASRATVTEQRASWCKAPFTAKRFKIGKHIRVHDMVPIMRPSDTHGCISSRWVPKTSIDKYPEKVVDWPRVPDAVLGLPMVAAFQSEH